MFDSRLRPLKDRVLAPAAGSLAALHPNAITAAALVVGVGATIACYQSGFGAALVLWILNRGLDGLDGLVARLNERVTDLGGYLDLIADFTVYAGIPVALALRADAQPALPSVALLLLASFYVNAASWMVLSAILEKRGHGAPARGESTSVTMPEGLVGGSETALAYGLFLVFPEHLVGLFLTMAVLTAFTVLQRIAWAVRCL